MCRNEQGPRELPTHLQINSRNVERGHDSSGLCVEHLHIAVGDHVANHRRCQRIPAPVSASVSPNDCVVSGTETYNAAEWTHSSLQRPTPTQKSCRRVAICRSCEG